MVEDNTSNKGGDAILHTSTESPVNCTSVRMFDESYHTVLMFNTVEY